MENTNMTYLGNVPTPATLDELIQELHTVFSEDRINVEYVQQLMTSYKSNPKEWKKFAKFDPHRYTRNLVDDGNGKFNLMALCWGEGHGSSIHAHSNSHCFLKVLKGPLKETLYEWPLDGEDEKQMTKRCDNLYKENECAYICDDMGLHRVENPSNADPAVSLHLYSPPFDMCHTFDERTGHKNTCKVTFWSQFGQRTPFKVNDAANVWLTKTKACCDSPCCSCPDPVNMANGSFDVAENN